MLNNYLDNKEKINIIKEKEKEKDKNNNTIEINKSNNFFSKSKYVNDVIIDNHITKNNHKPISKFSLDAYNYQIMQSIIQDRSNYFTIKNLNYFPFHYYGLNNNRYILNDRNDVNLRIMLIIYFCLLLKKIKKKNILKKRKRKNQ